MIRKVTEALFRVHCDSCEESIVLRAGNSWGAYRQLTEGGWGIGAKDLCWACVAIAPAKQKATAR